MPKKKKDIAARVIRVDVYDMDVAVFFSPEAADQYFQQEHGENGTYYQDAFSDKSTNALASRYTPEEGGALHCIIIPQPISGGELAHEVVHLIDYISDTIGMPCTLDTSEPRGYLAAFLFDAIWELCELWGKENPEWRK